MKSLCRRSLALFCTAALIISTLCGAVALSHAAEAPSAVVSRADFMDVNFIRGFEDNGPLHLTHTLYGSKNNSELAQSAELNRQVLKADGWINYPVTNEILKTITDRMTLEIAFKLPAGRSGTECLGGNLQGGGMGVEITKEGKLTVLFGLPGGGYTKLVTQVEAQKWYHLVASYDKAGEAVLYLNDQKITAVPTNGNSIKYNPDMPWMSIGANTQQDGNGIYTFHGEMALFRIYKKACSAQEARNLYTFYQKDPAYEAIYDKTQTLKAIDLTDPQLSFDYVSRVKKQIPAGEALVLDPSVTEAQAQAFIREAELLLDPLAAIQILSLPTQKEYLKDQEPLNLRGGVVKLVHQKGGVEELPMSRTEVTGFNVSQLGRQTLQVSYNNVSTSFDVTVVAKKLMSISIAREPNKTTYIAGSEQLDLTGGKLDCVYSDGTREEIDLSAAAVTGFDGASIGRQTLTVTYHEKRTSFTVSVIRGAYIVQNLRTGIRFATLEEAVKSTQAEDTLQLLKDGTAGDVMLTGNLTLDLNGHQLTARHLVVIKGSRIMDSGEQGLLVIGRENLILPEDNTQISIWNGQNGYLFRTLNLDQKFVLDRTFNGGRGMKLLFKPVFGSRVFETELFADGCKDNGLQIHVEFMWDSVTDSDGSQKFTYADALTRQVYGQPNKGFSLLVGSVEHLPNVRARLVVESITGVRLSKSIIG